MSSAKFAPWFGRIVTALFALLMVLSAIPDLLQMPNAVAIIGNLGYPPYLLVFLGTAKLLGVAAVLVPGMPTLKEWAFAGLTFDLSGALYSHLSVGDPSTVWMPAAIGLLLAAVSYLAYRSPGGRWRSDDRTTAIAAGTAGLPLRGDM
jgi:hypothetical protein